MFTDVTFKKYHISENDKLIGDLEVNAPLVASTEFMLPFIRETDLKRVTKIGNRDYEKLNAYIIHCMKDYYERLMGSSSISERGMMLKTYEHLYEMWNDLHNFKRSNNLVEMDKTYDLFSYELYVLGYTD